MYVYIYIYIYTHVSVCTYIYIYIYTLHSHMRWLAGRFLRARTCSHLRKGKTLQARRSLRIVCLKGSVFMQFPDLRKFVDWPYGPGGAPWRHSGVTPPRRRRQVGRWTESGENRIGGDRIGGEYNSSNSFQGTESGGGEKLLNAGLKGDGSHGRAALLRGAGVGSRAQRTTSNKHICIYIYI